MADVPSGFYSPGPETQDHEEDANDNSTHLFAGVYTLTIVQPKSLVSALWLAGVAAATADHFMCRGRKKNSFIFPCKERSDHSIPRPSRDSVVQYIGSVLLFLRGTFIGRSARVKRNR